MTAKLCVWDGFRKNIIEREVKKLSSLDVRLILHVEFDISVNFNRSRFGKRDHELVDKMFKM